MRSPEAAFSHEREISEPLTFEAYRQLCDMTNDFRKVGIQDESSYEAILQDEKTVFVDYEGCKIPLLAPLGYEKMYHEERCLAMSGKKRAMLLAMPFAHLNAMQLERELELEEDTVIVVEEFVTPEADTSFGQHDLSRLPFSNVEAFDFESRALINHPANATAWMAAYGFDIRPKHKEVHGYDGSTLAAEMWKGWNGYCDDTNHARTPEANATGTFLLTVDQLAERPGIIEQLWDVSQIGFGQILGEDHPVSMEFNKQFFDKQVRSDNTMTALHLVEGEVVCFGFVGLDMNHNDWLNEDSDVVRGVVEGAASQHKALVHFHELIGRGKRGMGHAAKILGIFFEVVSRTQYPYKVFFESTNLSSLYIPPLIARNLERSEVVASTSEIKMLGKLSYWGLVANKRT